MENNKNQINRINNDDRTLIDNIEDDKTIVDAVIVNENGEEVKTQKTISRKTAMLVGGGVLLGGTLLGAGIANAQSNEIQFDNNADGIADTLITDTDNNGIYETETKVETTETESETLQTQTWNPNTAPIAGTVNDEMSFSEAFASARQELGAGGVFEWHGQYYGTFYAEEVDSNHQPTIEYPTVAEHDLPTLDYEPVIEEVYEEEVYVTVTEETEVEITDVDIDNDGFADAVYVEEDITTTVEEVTVVNEEIAEVEITQYEENNDYLLAYDDMIGE